VRKRTIIYISGEGHSGTTMLDAVLGNHKNTFSSGELTNFVKKGIINREYCACGRPVPECKVWSEIIKEWDKKRVLSLEKYIQIQNKLTSKKNIVSSLVALKKGSGEISEFLRDTNKLYNVIFKITGSQIIVDSSKTPGRILILKQLDFDVQVLHLVRRFGDVLNSYKKHTPKNLKEGVEYEIRPLNSIYVLSSWLVKNLLTYFFSKDLSYKKIKYENLVINPLKELSFFVEDSEQFINKLTDRGPFELKHLVAGNKIRMKENLYIAEKPMGTSLHRLNRADRVMAKFVDFFY